MKNIKGMIALTIVLIGAVFLAGCSETVNAPEQSSAEITGETTAETAVRTVAENSDNSETAIIEDVPADVFDDNEIIDDEVDEDAYYNDNTEGFVRFVQTEQVGTMDEYGGVSLSNNDDCAAVAMEIPGNYEMSYNVGYSQGEKAFEIGALWYAEQGFDPENMKTDMVSGREITVYEEETGAEGLYEYMLHSSVPVKEDENGIYETYRYIVKRGEYMMTVSFLAKFYDKDTAEHILGSIEITEADRNDIS